MPGFGSSLILPVILGTATWAVERFTVSSLGDWRFIPVAILGLGTLYFTIIAVVLALIAMVGAKFHGPTIPRWLHLTTRAGFAGLVATGVILKFLDEAQHPNTFDILTMALTFTGGVLLIAWDRFPKLGPVRAKWAQYTTYLFILAVGVFAMFQSQK